MIPNVGPLELIVVLVIALVVLGPKRLPEVGGSVGKELRHFKAALNGENEGRGRIADAAPLEAGQAIDRSDDDPSDEPDPRREVAHG